MSYRTITINRIEILGEIWMPSILAAQAKDLSSYDVENIRNLGNGELTREACQRWLDTHAGDFQNIVDFHADIEDFDSPWENEENECKFNDSMYGEEE